MLFLNRNGKQICLFGCWMIFYSDEQRDWLYLMSFISCVSCWLGVFRIQAQWWFQKSCLWDKNKLQAASQFFCEPIVLPWTSFFTVRITESGPESGEYSIALVETDKVILLDCRLKVHKMRLKLTCWLTVATNEKSIRLCHDWIEFWFFLAQVHVDCDWRRNFFKTRDGFPLPLSQQLFCKAT